MTSLDRRARIVLVIGLFFAGTAVAAAPPRGTYQDLVALFAEFVTFERPTQKDGAPDYTAATLLRKQARLKTFQSRLAAIDSRSWPVEQQVDHALVRATMNGL